MKKHKKIKQILLLTTSISLILTGCGGALGGERFDQVTSALGPETMDGGYSNNYYNTGSSISKSDGFYISEETIEMEDYVAPEFNTEEYNSIKENSFIKVSSNPLSTFAMDVDTGSYTNFRRMVNDRYNIEEIPSGAIRTEEMINYFTYDFANKVELEEDSRFNVSYEIQNCPWNEDNKVLAMTIQANEVEERHNGNNFVYLIDSSGSMDSDDKGLLALKSFEMLSETLTEDDVVSIVTYSGASDTLLEGCDGDNTKKIEKALDKVQFGGGTNGSGGIEAAYAVAEEYFIKGGNNRVIIASDGDMNLGITSQSDLVDLIEEKKESGIFLTVLGYGSGNYSDANMESIANAGNGNYYYIDCEEEAEYVLVEKLKQSTVTIAKDVKLQVEFNPTKVDSYRLLGYENRTMSSDDFEDDTKDGGETGAGQQVTVLYELELVNEETTGSELKYQGDRELTEEANSNEILTLSIRYKEPDEDKSKLEEFAIEETNDEKSSDFDFVCGIAELSMILIDSDYIGEATLESAYDLINENSMENERREELAELIEDLM